MASSIEKSKASEQNEIETINNFTYNFRTENPMCFNLLYHLLRNYLLFSFATNKFSLEFCKTVLDNRVIQSNYSYKKLCP